MRGRRRSVRAAAIAATALLRARRGNGRRRPGRTAATRLRTSASTPPPSNASWAPATDVRLHRETGLVRFIGTAPGRPVEVSSAGTRLPPPRVRSWTNTARRSDSRTAPTLRGSPARSPAPYGTAVRMRQEIGGVPVVGGEVTVNVDRSGDILSVLGEAVPRGGGRHDARGRRGRRPGRGARRGREERGRTRAHARGDRAKPRDPRLAPARRHRARRPGAGLADGDHG